MKIEIKLVNILPCFILFTTCLQSIFISVPFQVFFTLFLFIENLGLHIGWLKFGHSEKAIKIRNNIPLDLTFTK